MPMVAPAACGFQCEAMKRHKKTAPGMIPEPLRVSCATPAGRMGLRTGVPDQSGRR
jgi:hypothetical protein